MSADNQNRLINGLASLIALQTVIAAILVGAFWILHRDLRELSDGVTLVRQALDTTRKPQRIEDWRAYIRPHNAALGASDAKVVLTVYSEFQCPYCRKFAQSTHGELIDEYGDDVRIVFKHLPLVQIHSEAMVSAIAAQCANRSGKFWELHDLLFEHQESLSTETVLALGRSIGLGGDFESCVLNEETRAEVDQDLQDAAKLGIAGTPTFVLNGDVVQGAQPFEAFKPRIDSLLASRPL